MDAAHADGSGVVVDLTGVTFLASSGLAVLIGGARRLTELGGRLRLVAASRSVTRPLQVTGADALFDIHDDVALRPRRECEGRGSIAASASEGGADRGREPTIQRGGQGRGSIAASASERGADRAESRPFNAEAKGAGASTSARPEPTVHCRDRHRALLRPPGE